MDPIVITLVGIVIVFAVLILLVLLVSFFNVISEKFGKIGKKTKTIPKKEESIVEETVTNVAKDDKKIVAVITATLMASVYSGTNTRFVVKKIKKI